MSTYTEISLPPEEDFMLPLLNFYRERKSTQFDYAICYDAFKKFEKYVVNRKLVDPETGMFLQHRLTDVESEIIFGDDFYRRSLPRNKFAGKEKAEYNLYSRQSYDQKKSREHTLIVLEEKNIISFAYKVLWPLTVENLNLRTRSYTRYQKIYNKYVNRNRLATAYVSLSTLVPLSFVINTDTPATVIAGSVAGVAAFGYGVTNWAHAMTYRFKHKPAKEKYSLKLEMSPEAKKYVILQSSIGSTTPEPAKWWKIGKTY